MGIQGHNAATFDADDIGVQASVSSLSRKSSALRRSSMGIHTQEDMADLQKSTSDILREEEAKRKKGKKTQDGPALPKGSARGNKTQDPRQGK
jgi:hypothetical protein